MFGDIWDCELGFELDRMNLMEERINLSLFVKLLWFMKQIMVT